MNGRFDIRDDSINGPAIEAVGVTKTFVPRGGIVGLLGHATIREPITAVDEVDLRVERGELFGLLGPNGAGKTTLIKILCTLIVPTTGTARVDGSDVVLEEQQVRRSIGLVGSEERSFYWRLTGRRNLEFFASLHGLRGEKMHRRIKEVLALMELESVADRMFQTYSTGMKQKMCIARGLLTDPAVLFLDEPTRSLDPLVAESIRNFIKDVLVRKQGRTVVLTTHRLEEAAQVCDRIAIMNRGRIRACGSLDDLRAILMSPCRYELRIGNLGGGLEDRLRRIVSAEGLEIVKNSGDGHMLRFHSPRDSSSLRDVIREVVESGADVLDCQMEEVSLDEIFSHLVRDKHCGSGVDMASSK